MKIIDYQLIKIEAAVSHFFKDNAVPYEIVPGLVWPNYGGPIIRTGYKSTSVNKPNMILISDCVLRPASTTHSESYQIIAYVKRSMTKQFGKHTALAERMKPLADSMNCKLEVNYSKHYYDINKITVTMYRHEN